MDWGFCKKGGREVEKSEGEKEGGGGKRLEGRWEGSKYIWRMGMIEIIKF